MEASDEKDTTSYIHHIPKWRAECSGLDDFLQRFWRPDESGALRVNSDVRVVVVKGHIQSGKTQLMMYVSMFGPSILEMNVIVVLRDKCADREQYYERMIHLLQAQNMSHIPVHKDVTRASTDTKGQIILCLSNIFRLNQVNTFLAKCAAKPYILLVDESDFVDSCNLIKKSPAMELLKQNAALTFNISGTILDTVFRTQGDNQALILLQAPPKYKGFLSLNWVEIKESAQFSARLSSDLFAVDSGLVDYIQKLVSKPKMEIPHISLINICRTKAPCLAAQARLTDLFPSLSILVYNGDGICYRKGAIQVDSKQTLSSFLQFMKLDGGVEKHPHIVIFSGDLAGRGISFVSSDYKWHLTEQRLLISNSCDEPESMQKIRLQGIYDDDIPLTLYTTNAIYTDLKRAFTRQEEILLRLKDSNELPQTMSIEKKTKRKMCKDPKMHIHYVKDVSDDDEWPCETYALSSLPPNEFYDAYNMDAPDASERSEFAMRIRAHPHESGVGDSVDSKKPQKRSKTVEKIHSDTDIKTGTYYLIDEDDLKNTNVAREMITHTISQILEKRKVGQDVSRIEINQLLLQMNHELFTSEEQLNGSWFVTIHKHMKPVPSKEEVGLIYWTNDPQESKHKHYFLRLNMTK